MTVDEANQLLSDFRQAFRHTWHACVMQVNAGTVRHIRKDLRGGHLYWMNEESYVSPDDVKSGRNFFLCTGRSNDC